MKKQLLHIILLLFPLLFGSLVVKAQSFPYEYIIRNGAPSSKINLVFVGDGYLPSQMNRYISDVTSATNKMFQMEPFRSLKGNFNVIAVKVPSNSQGAASSPNNLINNYFGSTFNYSGIQRLLVATRSGRISSVINNSFPQSDQGIIIVNDSRYGGSGGAYATLSTNSAAPDLLVHELGHSYADLADEYWFRAQEKANQTSNGSSSTNRWRQFIGRAGVGIYRYESPGSNYYRPHQSCKMRYLSSNFCLVCQNHIRKVTNNLGGDGGGETLAIPANLVAQNVGATSFGITWSSVSNASSYDIQLWNGSDWINKGNTSTTSFSFSGLVPNGTEYARVRATNSTSASEWTSYVTVQLNGTDVATPARPTDLKSYNINPTYFGIYWTTVDEATSYDIQRWTGSEWEFHGNTSSYYYYLNDLPAGSTQYVRVRSKNSVGTSDYTEYITVVLGSAGSSALRPEENLPNSKEVKNQIALFPNPVTRELHIQGPPDQNTGVISVFALSGELILEEKFNTDTLMLDVSVLQSGTFIVIVKYDDGSSIVKRFVKE
ncbi:hypothetical protein AWE51_15610 [Aquimarina aggregata]|uniref:Fibronectin type-III domain-containing protein n=1 Tax=Aquimarina aggregata TaxID=1642818 RepID=A0A163CVL6_9FLAO|nr:M64 family metallopeptidase [Aquimarina aggregata]KZS42796.1 hypothetical protein AWE51_15610 [Aquimarina aggregata]